LLVVVVVSFCFSLFIGVASFLLQKPDWSKKKSEYFSFFPLWWALFLWKKILISCSTSSHQKKKDGKL
jgi:hypothetical protein